MLIHHPFVFFAGLLAFAVGVFFAVLAHKHEFGSGWLADLHMFFNLIAAAGLLGGGFTMVMAFLR
jgi:hypothetical protein